MNTITPARTRSSKKVNKNALGQKNLSWNKNWK